MGHPETISFGSFVLDRRRQILTRNGEAVALGHRGYLLLEALIDAAGETVDKTTLMERAWPGMIIEEGNLTVQIAALRKALGPESEPLIVTVPRVGYRFVTPLEALPVGADLGGGPPLIAVLPFANLSSDADQAFFADGMVEDIIAALSRFRQFAVVARNSSFVYRDRLVDVRVAARELGVRYVLEGSVRRAGNRVRVTAQLIDAESAAHIWADKFDGDFADIFDFQDRITESVVGLIEPQIRKSEIERARRKRPENLDAYELFLRAGPMILGPERAEWNEAIELLHRAISLDPGYAPAYAICGWAHEKRNTFGGDAPPGIDDKAIALEMSEKALALERDDAVVLAVAAWNIILLGRDRDRGHSLASRAVELNPNHVLVLNFAALCFTASDSNERARECNLRALRLSPGAPDAYWSCTNLAGIAIDFGRYEEAVDWCLKALAINNGWEVTWASLTTAYVYLERMDDARRAVAQMLAINPSANLDSLDPAGVSHDPFRRRVRDALRRAGLPER